MMIVSFQNLNPAYVGTAELEGGAEEDVEEDDETTDTEESDGEGEAGEVGLEVFLPAPKTLAAVTSFFTTANFAETFHFAVPGLREAAVEEAKEPEAEDEDAAGFEEAQVEDGRDEEEEDDCEEAEE